MCAVRGKKKLKKFNITTLITFSPSVRLDCEPVMTRYASKGLT